jgi:AraC-like DNA-binding protein
LNEVTHLKFICTLNGHINFQLGNYQLQCGPGYFIFIPPGTPHPDSSFSYVDTEKSTSCDILYFQLLSHALHCWIDRSRVGQPLQKESNFLIQEEHTVMLFRVLLEKIFNGEANSLAIAETLLPVSLQLLQHEVRNRNYSLIPGDNPDDIFQKLVADTQEHHFAARLEHYVQANLHKPLTLEKAARAMYLSRTQFTSTVRRETGKSFNQLLMEHRLEAAKQALLDSSWTISAIATWVGFRSPSYFRTIFHKHTGKTPTEFREQARRNK